MKKPVLAILTLLTLLALATGPAMAGPRWWWDDAAVAVTSGDSLNPDVAVVTVNTLAIPREVIVVAWNEIPLNETDSEIFVTVSYSDQMVVETGDRCSESS